MSVTTLSELFLKIAEYDKPDCLMYKVDGVYKPMSTAELVTRVQKLARALSNLGVVKGDRVALMAESGPHWPTVDFAALSVGAVLVPIYPTLPPDQASYVARDCGAKVLFVHGRERLSGLLAERDNLPAVEHWVAIGVEPSDSTVKTLDGLLASTEPDKAAFEAAARAVKPEDNATFIYTSGTTGYPKGVILTHNNIVSNMLDSLKVMNVGEGWTALSFLPLSHSFERLVDYIYFYRRVGIAYAESVQTVAANLQEVRPHVFVSVPRVYEKVLSRVYENAAKSSPTKQKIFNWAIEIGRQCLPWRLRHQSPPGLLGLKLAIADKLVFSKVRERLGGRFTFAFSGGAPLSRDVAEFFWGAGIPIYEGYGLTETSPVITVNAERATKLGSVGKVIPNCTVVIADDGEILARGPNIMRGYWGNQKATDEVIDKDGWFHTGDIGVLDDEGFLAITDRKKELIVNAYGKNIAPAPIENALKGKQFVSQAVVIGDKRNFLTALIVPDFETLEAWAKGQGLPSDRAALLAHPKVKAIFKAGVDSVNEHLAKYEHIIAWELVGNEFTIDGGELTPTLKVKRRVINEKYKATLDRLYAGSEKGG
jgi:long-chain acyl-CoA synthetase